MKALTVFALLFAVLFTALKVAPVLMNEHQQGVNAARYAQQKADSDARMQRACDAHQTGVVLYYKGKDCSQ